MLSPESPRKNKLFQLSTFCSKNWNYITSEIWDTLKHERNAKPTLIFAVDGGNGIIGSLVAKLILYTSLSLMCISNRNQTCLQQKTILIIQRPPHPPKKIPPPKKPVQSSPVQSPVQLFHMAVLLNNLLSLILNPVYLKWTPNVVAIHGVHCQSKASNRLQKFCTGASLFVFNFSRSTQ